MARLPQAKKPPTIMVWPRDDNMRRYLKHPSGIGFRADINEGMPWPNDQFTMRRLAEGAVLRGPPHPEWKT